MKQIRNEAALFKAAVAAGTKYGEERGVMAYASIA
jgi:hypothetical protein